MSPSQQSFITADETRLSILFRDAANLDLQLYELNKLRYLVRQAQRLARSRHPRRIHAGPSGSAGLASDRPSDDARLRVSCPDVESATGCSSGGTP